MWWVEWDAAPSTTPTYTIGEHRSSTIGALIDRGANGGVAGADVRILSSTHGHTACTAHVPDLTHSEGFWSLKATLAVAPTIIGILC